MNRIAGIAGFRLHCVAGPSWNEFMEMVAAGELDVMLNIVDLPKRRALLRFSFFSQKPFALPHLFAYNPVSDTHFTGR